jgi:hypothetical protein
MKTILSLTSVAVTAGAVALSLLCPPPAADAAPQSASPFHGSYLGYVPGEGGPWSIRISSRGVVTGTLSERTKDVLGHPYSYRGRLSGTISDAGGLSFSGSLSWDDHSVDGWGPTYVPAGSEEFSVEAQASFDVNGDLACEMSNGSYFYFFTQ